MTHVAKPGWGRRSARYKDSAGYREIQDTDINIVHIDGIVDKVLFT
ncbi:MAG: hypothetical protein HRF40_03790 [Nitrososphaera sp.]